MKSFLLLAACAACLALPSTSAAAPSKPKARPSFAAADTDGDGRVTPREYTAATKGQMDAAAAKAKFAELDKNKDGALSSAEFTDAADRKKAAKKPKKEMPGN